MEDGQPARTPFDVQEYTRRSREGPCFVCALLAGHPGYPHHDVYEDDDTIAFLARPATLLGYCLVAPRRHIESWVHDLDEPEFLRLQAVAHRVARAIAATVPTERMYALSLGSQQGNAHLHWHLARCRQEFLMSSSSSTRSGPRTGCSIWMTPRRQRSPRPSEATWQTATAASPPSSPAPRIARSPLSAGRGSVESSQRVGERLQDVGGVRRGGLGGGQAGA